MKYSVEVTKKGYIETLEIYGAVYQKRWIKQIGGASCNDKEFWEQLKDAGVTDEEVLYAIEDEIDNDFFASDVARIAEESEQYVPDTDVGDINGWIPVEKCLPDNSEYILLSFANFSVPSVGRYEEDSEGGAFYVGDEEDSCVSQGMLVDAWQPLPEQYRKGE